MWAAFIIGLAGSWHCIGMCGPIALMIPGAKGKKRWQAIGLYQLGKIFGYVVIGIFFGLLGTFLHSFDIQSWMTISAGVLIGVLAFIPSILNYVERKGFRFFRGIVQFKNKLSKKLKKDSIEYGFYIGFFNGFIPCGLVYVAAIGALVQESLFDTVLYMVLFGLGTVPFMTILLFSASSLKSKFSTYAPKIRFAVFTIVSIFMIWKGINMLSVEMEQPKECEDFMICSTLTD